MGVTPRRPLGRLGLALSALALAGCASAGHQPPRPTHDATPAATPAEARPEAAASAGPDRPGSPAAARKQPSPGSCAVLVDKSRLLQESRPGVRSMATLRRSFEQRRERIQKVEQALLKEREEITRMPQGPAQAARTQRFAQKTEEFQRQILLEQQQLTELTRAETDSVQQCMMTLVIERATARGCVAVYDRAELLWARPERQQDAELLAGRPGEDITGEMLSASPPC